MMIKITGRPISKKPKKCLTCGEIFKVFPSYNHRKFCSRSCYLLNMKSKRTTVRRKNKQGKTKSYYEHTCLHCKKNFLSRDMRAKTCSYKCAGKIHSLKLQANPSLHPHWRQGNYLRSDGYKAKRVARGKYIAEHRLIMEKHLKRSLKAGEVVHHLNGNRLDNRIENLHLLSASEHGSLHAPKGYKFGEYQKICP